ncbi:MAG: hypothetical protein GXO76_05015 [Calditrichaeota bacterium]|nr:hypothetical protein [Calditrichota bacterium]
MADEEKKASQTDDKKDVKKGGSLKKVVMIWIPLFLLQLALSYIIVTKVFKRKAIQQEAEAAEMTTHGKNRAKKPQKPGEIYLVEDVIVNPKNTEGRHFVNVSVGLEEGNKNIGDELKNRDAQIRDTLIDIFVSKTIQEMDDVADKDSLKSEIARRLNRLLGAGAIRHVYFSNFIIQ